jgi:hypothetical protein
MDMMRNACDAAVQTRGIARVRFGDLDEAFQEDFRRVFPARVLDEATLYFEVPFHDGAVGVGLLSMLGMMSQGGGLVLAMTFENDVYLYCSLESLADGPALPAVLAHELCHVAQYQALGYDGYKERYADELARGIPYERLSIERDAYTLAKLFPNLVPPGFFAFLPPTPGTRKQVVSSQDLGPDFVPLRAEEVRITATFESLERRASLAFPREESEPALHPQVIDPCGGPPLHAFERVEPKDARLLHNDPVTENGPVLVAVGDDSGAEVAWRELDGFRSQWIPGAVRFDDINGDGLMDIEQCVGDDVATWWWTGSGFAKMAVCPRNESVVSGDDTE